MSRGALNAAFFSPRKVGHSGWILINELKSKQEYVMVKFHLSGYKQEKSTTEVNFQYRRVCCTRLVFPCLFLEPEVIENLQCRSVNIRKTESSRL